MAADFSRVRLNPLLDYAGVELKQGAVLLDADANELVGIVDRRLRALASDVLGRATVSSTTPDAFKLTLVAGALQIGVGRLYVDGLPAENHGAVSTDPAKKVFDDLMGEAVYTDAIAYAAQPYLPSPPALPTAGKHLVYLDVWSREVTAFEDPALVEGAVGVETSSRRQTVWQVRVMPDDAGSATTCATPDGDVPGWAALIAPSTGLLTTGTYDVPPSDDPCELPPTGGYRGLENQLYRVEIHDAGQPGSGATFKWSRENASVRARVASMVSGSELQLDSLGRDDVLRFNTGDWVEITDDVRELSQAAGEMRRITVDDATQRITFSPALPTAMLSASFPDSTFPAARHTRVTRWDQRGKVFRTDSSGTPVQVQDLDAGGSTGVIAVPAAGTTLLLEDGITVSFASTGTKGFKAGDSWAFAARTADASVELLDNAPPRGIHHHYARLGLWDVAAGTLTDCRHRWPPAGDGHDCSCDACVTPESHASGQFTIQDAVNQVSQAGGTVCLAVGRYVLAEPVRLVNARSLRIRGHGPATLVVSPGAAFVLQRCVAVAIEQLMVLSLGRQSALSVNTVLGLALQQLVIAVLGNADAKGAAISLAGVVGAATLRDNAILAPIAVLALDPAAPSGGDNQPQPTVLLTAGLTIEDNLLWCQRQGITLNGNVLHLLATRIAGNQLLGCREVGISALGLGAPGSSMGITGNGLSVTGSGIRSGVDGLWISDNKLHNTATATVATANNQATTVGIALATGLDKSGPDQCQMLANQIHGFALAGIAIGSPVRDLIVKLNIIDRCGSGILSTDEAKAGSVSIENNHLRDIGPASANEGSTLPVIGIGVARADAATVAGNTLRAVGVQALQSALRVGILGFGVGRIRVQGNEVVDLAPPGDFVGLAVGILLRAPFSQFEVHHNQVMRDGQGSTQGSNGAWVALLAADFSNLAAVGATTTAGPPTTGAAGTISSVGTVGNAGSAVMRTGPLVTVQLDEARVLVLGSGRAYVAGLSSPNVVAAAAAVVAARGAVLGNALAARGSALAVELVAAGECLFNDNRVESAGNDRLPAVLIATPVVLVQGNRVRSGGRSIQVIGSKTAAVLGNVTTGAIVVPGGLVAPWDALNLQG